MSKVLLYILGGLVVLAVLGIVGMLVSQALYNTYPEFAGQLAVTSQICTGFGLVFAFLAAIILAIQVLKE